MYYTNTTQPKCSVNITTNRNRVKSYDGKVYLKDGQKFELEIFNPHNYKVLAKIKMNGHYISDSGIVLNPGQRVYLERYLDSNNTFIFSTYEVDGTVEALKAIAENGNIEVEFYNEYIPSGTYISTTADWTVRPNTFDFYTTNLNEVTYGSNIVGETHTYFSSDVRSASMNTKSLNETGRVEKGQASNQNFTNDYGTYNPYVSETLTVKLLPVSAKPIEAKEIRNYCTECGTRMKKATWKFCPNCGSKI